MLGSAIARTWTSKPTQIGNQQFAMHWKGIRATLRFSTGSGICSTHSMESVRVFGVYVLWSPRHPVLNDRPKLLAGRLAVRVGGVTAAYLIARRRSPYPSSATRSSAAGRRQSLARGASPWDTRRPQDPAPEGRQIQSHKYRSSNAIPCAFRNTRSSSWNVTVRWCSSCRARYAFTLSIAE
jgi:hypothetical protein